MNIIKLLKKIIKYKGLPTRNSTIFIKYLKNEGVKIGENCVFYSPKEVKIDLQNPYMIQLGNNVRITSGVQILTHDYSFSVLAAVKGDLVGSVEKVTIGNNVFIGRNVIILKGSKIEDNVIVGAGSIVSGTLKANNVYAGVPAKKICSISEMYEKRKSREKENAKNLAISFYERTGKIPDMSILREYSLLYSKRTEPIPKTLEKLMRGSGNYDLCLNYYKNSESEFNNIDEFIKWCGIEKE